VSFFNKAWLDFTGRVKQQQRSLTAAEGIHQDDYSVYMDIYSSSFVKRQPFSAEYRLLRSDGEYRWMLENARPTFAPNGEFTGYIGSCSEIHPQKTNNLPATGNL
jgi:two-component system CheB/CheR fusion protein